MDKNERIYKPLHFCIALTEPSLCRSAPLFLFLRVSLHVYKNNDRLEDVRACHETGTLLKRQLQIYEWGQSGSEPWRRVLRTLSLTTHNKE